MLRKRFKKRLPTARGFVQFWRPTLCPMCYWWRLSIPAAVANTVNGHEGWGWVVPLSLFMVGVIYGLIPEKQIKQESNMSKLVIKKAVLEELINQELEEVKSQPWVDTSSFAIHQEGDVQVQVVVTRDPDEQGKIFKPYAEGRDD